MIPSYLPIPYLLHLLVVGGLLAFVGFIAWTMNQPLGLALIVFGLNALPELPIVQPGEPEPADPEYHGSGRTGFVP